MRYEEWESEDSIAFLADDDEKVSKLAIAAPHGARLVWWIEADTWDEACRAQHEHRGWEPFAPID
jgi:hypothetical protein